MTQALIVKLYRCKRDMGPWNESSLAAAVEVYSAAQDAMKTGFEKELLGLRRSLARAQAASGPASPR